MAGRVPAVAGEQPLLRLAPETAPVDAQLFEQLRAEHDVAVLAALALMDVNHHPLAVDVADLEAGRFCAACAGGIHASSAGCDEKEYRPRRSVAQLLPD